MHGISGGDGRAESFLITDRTEGKHVKGGSAERDATKNRTDPQPQLGMVAFNAWV